MEKTTNGWTVLDREAGVLTYEYAFATEGTAQTFVARMMDGKLLVVSPAWKISNAALDDLAAFGEVGALIAPNGYHHQGFPEWRAKFPEARCFAAQESAARIRKKNSKAGDFEPFSLLQEMTGADIGIREVESTKCGETWLWVQVRGGTIWFVSDTLVNLPHLPSNIVARWLFQLTKSAPGYKVFNMALKMMVKDKQATLRALAEEMASRPPTIVVPSHGPALIDKDIAKKTQELIAAQLR